MAIISRAGLCTLVLLLCLTLATSAPLPSRLSSLTVRSDNHINTLVKRTGTLLIQRDDSEAASEYTKRDDLEAQELVRRKSVGAKIKSAFKKAGQGIKKAAQKVGQGVKKAAQGVKKAAQKVGKFVKTTGAKVAKFGLKIASAASSVASKAAKFIPGVGSAISKGLQAHSMATNAIANRIKVPLGKKLDKGVKVLDKIRNPVGGAAGAVLNAFRREDEDEEMLERDVLGFDEQSIWARVPEETTEEDVLSREFDLDAEVEERDDEEYLLERDVDAELEEREF